jgi:hypothetical protein
MLDSNIRKIEMSEIRQKDVKTYVRKLISEILGMQEDNAKSSDHNKDKEDYETPSTISAQNKIIHKNKSKVDGL